MRSTKDLTNEITNRDNFSIFVKLGRFSAGKYRKPHIIK